MCKLTRKNSKQQQHPAQKSSAWHQPLALRQAQGEVGMYDERSREVLTLPELPSPVPYELVANTPGLLGDHSTSKSQLSPAGTSPSTSPDATSHRTVRWSLALLSSSPASWPDQDMARTPYIEQQHVCALYATNIPISLVHDKCNGYYGTVWLGRRISVHSAVASKSCFRGLAYTV